MRDNLKLPPSGLLWQKNIRAYEFAPLHAAVAEIIAAFPDFAASLMGKEVLLKPNLLFGVDPNRAVTTHPLVVAAVAAVCRELGARVYVGDSPGGVHYHLEDVWLRCGLTEAAKKYDFELVNLELSGVKEYDIGTEIPLYLAAAVDEYDLIINLPKLKTHGLTGYTGAVKNTFGLVPGMYKARFHKIAPDISDFSAIIVKLYQLVRPEFTIIDGVWGMDGDGPSVGSPRYAGLLAGSDDGVALDVHACRMVGIDIERVAILQQAIAAGVGHPEPVSVQGDEVSSVKFELPVQERGRRIPSWIKRWFYEHLRILPEVDTALCKRCGACVAACPTRALSIAGKTQYPELNKSACIECFCCHELCRYRAINLKRSLLLRLLLRR